MSWLIAAWAGFGLWSAIRFSPARRREAIPARPVPRTAAVVRSLVTLRSRRRRRDHAQLKRDLPDVVDLLVLAVGAGLTVPLAVEVVVQRSQGPVAEALRWARARAERGEPLADALEASPERFGDPLRQLVRPLVATQRYGVPLLQALESLATNVRLDRRHAAEREARRLPVRLLFPLVLCILPSFALLTVVPVIVSSLAAIDF